MIRLNKNYFIFYDFFKFFHTTNKDRNIDLVINSEYSNVILVFVIRMKFFIQKKRWKFRDCRIIIIRSKLDEKKLCWSVILIVANVCSKILLEDCIKSLDLIISLRIISCRQDVYNFQRFVNITLKLVNELNFSIINNTAWKFVQAINMINKEASKLSSFNFMINDDNVTLLS